MKNGYTVERNVQIVIELLKAYDISQVIASPGTTNMTFIASIQDDPFFTIYSSVDERSAAYLACGLAEESNRPVVISCTGATASRNYMPALTEAFYRKLPVLTITSHRGNDRVGHLLDQQIDRRQLPNDIAMESVTLPLVNDVEAERYCTIEANKAMNALFHRGGGPVHINLFTKYSSDFSVENVSPVAYIKRYTIDDKLPTIPSGRVGVFIGSHKQFTQEEIDAIDQFCCIHNAVVFCDHTSNYHGKYEVHFSLVCGQKNYISPCRFLKVLVHIGEVSGALYGHFLSADEVWRVSPDGALRNTFGKLSKVFEMSEKRFFDYYGRGNEQETTFYNECICEYKKVFDLLPELPFGNIWIARHLSDKMPSHSVIHFGILNSLRSWNFFELDKSIRTNCNVGGFGIDGGLSSLIGASLFNSTKLYFAILGDLAFFYDMNVLGNRHIGNNVRIMLINNGRGTEFRNYDHPCYPLGNKADSFLAAAGHFGNKSSELVKNYVTNLNFKYITASTKEEFLAAYSVFVDEKSQEQPIFFEVFTDTEKESEALEMMLNLVQPNLKQRIGGIAKNIVGDNVFSLVKSLMGK